MNEITTIIKKYGINGVLCICLYWMNGRLEKVEQHLFDCYEDQIQKTNANNLIKFKEPILAILPSKNEKKKKNENKKLL